MTDDVGNPAKKKKKKEKDVIHTESSSESDYPLAAGKRTRSSLQATSPKVDLKASAAGDSASLFTPEKPAWHKPLAPSIKAEELDQPLRHPLRHPTQGPSTSKLPKPPMLQVEPKKKPTLRRLSTARPVAEPSTMRSATLPSFPQARMSSLPSLPKVSVQDRAGTESSISAGGIAQKLPSLSGLSCKKNRTSSNTYPAINADDKSPATKIYNLGIAPTSRQSLADITIPASFSRKGKERETRDPTLPPPMSTSTTSVVMDEVGNFWQSVIPGTELPTEDALWTGTIILETGGNENAQTIFMEGMLLPSIPTAGRSALRQGAMPLKVANRLPQIRSPSSNEPALVLSLYSWILKSDESSLERVQKSYHDRLAFARDRKDPKLPIGLYTKAYGETGSERQKGRGPPSLITIKRIKDPDVEISEASLVSLWVPTQNDEYEESAKSSKQSCDQDPFKTWALSLFDNEVRTRSEMIAFCTQEFKRLCGNLPQEEWQYVIKEIMEELGRTQICRGFREDLRRFIIVAFEWVTADDVNDNYWEEM
ncbi:hypothetical protein FB446DRAFT_709075 [Lentinula raphanica]|nr:hypothetical protein FB446DRAFT_709075 [Lentinula raphanica]